MTGPWADYAPTQEAGPWADYAAPSIGVGEDLAKTALPSMARMAAGTLGLPGDVGGLLNRGIDFATSKLGLPSSPVNPDLLGSQQIEHGIEKVTGPLYKPQTTTGKLADTAAQFLPAILGGPETMLPKLATRVAAPAAGLEAAKAVTDNPYLQTVAAIASSALAHRAVTPGAAQAIIPEAEQIRAVARAGYEHPEVAAVQIRPAAVEGLADRITADLNRRGQLAVPESAGATHNVVDRLRDTGNLPGLPQGVASVAELRSVRSALGGMSTELNAQGRATSNAVAAGRAGRQIDAFLDGLRQPDLIQGNAQRASTILRAANRDWAAASKSATVDLQQMKADRQAGRSGSGSNIENSMRQKIDQVFGLGRESAAGLMPAERAAADRIVEGSPVRNALRKFGKLGFSDGLSLLLHTGAAIGTGGASIPLGIAGTVARKIGEGMTRRDIAALEEMFRARSAEAARMAAIHARSAIPQPGLLGGSVRGGLLSGAFAQPGRGLLDQNSIPSNAQPNEGILPLDSPFRMAMMDNPRGPRPKPQLADQFGGGGGTATSPPGAPALSRAEINKRAFTATDQLRRSLGVTASTPGGRATDEALKAIEEALKLHSDIKPF